MCRDSGRGNNKSLYDVFAAEKNDKEPLVVVREGLCADEQRILCEPEPCSCGKEQGCKDAAEDERHNEESMMEFCYKMKHQADCFRLAFIIFVCLAIWTIIFIYTSSQHQITHGPEDLPQVQLDGLRVYPSETESK